MNGKYIKINFECLGLQILFSVISMGLYNDFFPDVVFSLFTAWLFLWTIHSTFWQLGNKERKMIKIMNKNRGENEPEYKQNRLKGAIIAVPFFAANFIFLIVSCVLNKDILVTIQSILQFSFVGFLTPVDDILGWNYFYPRFIVCIVMYLTCIIAYLSGSYNYSFFDKYFHKIVYKTKKDD